MTHSEHYIQNLLRMELSKYGIVLRLNSGKFWQGKRVWSNEFKEYVLRDMKPVMGCPEGTSDLLFLGQDGTVAFIEVKDAKGKARPKQEQFINIMNQYGVRAGIARSVSDALKIIGVEEDGI